MPERTTTRSEMPKIRAQKGRASKKTLIKSDCFFTNSFKHTLHLYAARNIIFLSCSNYRSEYCAGFAARAKIALLRRLYSRKSCTAAHLLGYDELMNLWNESLWGDEGFSAIAVQKDFLPMLSVVMKDTAPPLFSKTIISLLFPSIVVGVVSR